MRALTLALTLTLAAMASCRGGDGVVGDPGDDDDHDGYSEDDGDCDDGDPLVYPGAAERCNAFDDDCDGYIDAMRDPDALWMICTCGEWIEETDLPDEYWLCP